MNFNDIKKELNAGKFVSRSEWNLEVIIWQKPSTVISATMCYDKNLKKLIEHFGNKDQNGSSCLKAEAIICAYKNKSIKSGYELKQEDIFADDWFVVDLNSL